MQKNLLQEFTNREEKFRSAVEDVGFQVKGIFNSEMFLFTSVAELLGVSLIIESGRARAQSTKVLGNYFADSGVEIKSVEHKKYTRDSIIAMNQLQGYRNIELLYGDSFDVIEKIITKPCVVLIDGPKRHEAMKLCLQLIQNNNVKAVGIHDVNKNTIFRKIIESVFTETVFSDELDFVNKYAYLDDPVWEMLPKYELTKDWAPYRVGNKKMESYGPTLGVIFNNQNPIRKEVADVYLETLLNLEAKIRRNTLENIHDIAQFYLEKLVYFIPFQLEHNKYLESIKLDKTSSKA